MPLRLAIALGDVTGIGPEVTLRALAAELPADDTCYLVIGDEACLRRTRDQLHLDLDWEPFAERQTAARIQVHNPLTELLPDSLPHGAPSAARAALAWLRDGARRALGADVNALVTAPVSKEAIVRSGQPFVGQTEFLSTLAGTPRTIMMLLGADDRGRWLRVALATTHLALRDVSGQITRDQVELAIASAARACRDLGLQRARIGVCGLNPHAGEGGEFGDEELTVIGPAVAAMRAGGLDVAGPLAADTLFHHAYRGDYDAVVAMYHDQGLAPLKMVAFENGINWTLGLPFIRTSPDHGTAYDIAGQGRASASSMRAAIRLARQLAAAGA
jgi:4-hydroxythreonine-4-phosphate dehydrogenase